jgi:aspartyl-tRNA(Asn)/glutamyl-tRNA(Gln) amidotransferase subunit A
VIAELTIAEAAEAMRAGELSAVDLTRAAIDQADLLDDVLGVYSRGFDGRARAVAAERDAELARGIDRGPLHGIPLGVKDIIAAAEGPTTAQSSALGDEWWRGEDASVVSRLRDAGAVVLGKTTTMEFAGGLIDAENPYALPRNPWDPARWPGGSSSGSGAGVAAGMMLGAVGSDTGGSIRCPAGFCGVSGHKPTFDLVPLDRVVPAGFTYDTVGPIARSAEDCAILLDAMSGSDTASGLRGDLRGIRIGVYRDVYRSQVVDAALEPALAMAIAHLEALGAEVREIAVPFHAELATSVMLGSGAESLAWHRERLRERYDDYGRNARRNLLTGLLLSASDLQQIARVRAHGAAAVRRMFRSEVDLVIAPTAPGNPPFLEGMTGLDGLPDNTAAWNAVGSPVSAVPIGFTAAGMPLSMQIAGPPRADALVLRAADAYQRVTTWHRAIPPIAQPAPAAA